MLRKTTGASGAVEGTTWMLRRVATLTHQCRRWKGVEFASVYASPAVKSHTRLHHFCGSYYYCYYYYRLPHRFGKRFRLLSTRTAGAHNGLARAAGSESECGLQRPEQDKVQDGITAEGLVRMLHDATADSASDFTATDLYMTVDRIAHAATKSGLDADPRVVAALFAAFCRTTHFIYAVGVLEAAVEANVLSAAEARRMISSALRSVARNNGSDAAKELFHLVQGTSFVDTTHYNIILAIAPAANEGVEALLAEETDLLADLQNAQLQPDTATYNARLQRRLGSTRAVQNTSGTTQVRESLRGAVGAGRWKWDQDPTVEGGVKTFVYDILTEMRYSGINPDKVTYLLLHRCCIEANPVPDPATAAEVLGEARRLLRREWPRHEISITAGHALEGLIAWGKPAAVRQRLQKTHPSQYVSEPVLQEQLAASLVWEYFSGLQIAGIADAYTLAKVLPLCDSLSDLHTLLAQMGIDLDAADQEPYSRRDPNSLLCDGTLGFALHSVLLKLGDFPAAVRRLEHLHWTAVNPPTRQDVSSSSTTPLLQKSLSSRDVASFEISTIMSNTLYQLLESKGRSAAWPYFSLLQDAGLADPHQYSIMINQCNTVEGLTQLLDEFRSSDGPSRGPSTGGDNNIPSIEMCAALQNTWLRLGQLKPALGALAQGHTNNGWPKSTDRRRIIAASMRPMLTSHANQNGSAKPFFTACNYIELVLAQAPQLIKCGVEGAHVQEGSLDVSDQPVNEVLRACTEWGGNREIRRLLELCSTFGAQVQLDGQACLRLLRRCVILGDSQLAAQVLYRAKSGTVPAAECSRLATTTMRFSVDQAKSQRRTSASPIQLLCALHEHKLADTFQFNVGLRFAAECSHKVRRSRAQQVAVWLDWMQHSSQGDALTARLVRRGWPEIASERREWLRKLHNKRTRP